MFVEYSSPYAYLVPRHATIMLIGLMVADLIPLSPVQACHFSSFTRSLLSFTVDQDLGHIDPVIRTPHVPLLVLFVRPTSDP